MCSCAYVVWARPPMRALCRRPARRATGVSSLSCSRLVFQPGGSLCLHGFTEYIRILNQHRVRYLVINGYAVAFHGHPRATDDVDVLIAPEEENIRRIERAPGVPMFFYDEASVKRELGAYGITEVSEIDEPVGGGSYPFYNVTCVKC